MEGENVAFEVYTFYFRRHFRIFALVYTTSSLEYDSVIK
ncbi:hypothetical protein LEP1GSC088_3734 [Leptospira interrogans str. L1207]|nr:hypothetical protein LEP1GSC088_3734 [Leptospira interrogans str. L1207]